MLKRASQFVQNVMANASAFLAASSRTDYDPEELARLLYFHPAAVAEALYRLGLLDRREFERRAARSYLPAVEFGDECDRRIKERRGDLAELAGWGSDG